MVSASSSDRCSVAFACRFTRDFGTSAVLGEAADPLRSRGRQRDHGARIVAEVTCAL
jgi:hypothetical protein